MPVRLLYLLVMIFSVLPVVLVFLMVVACVIFPVLPVVLVFLAAVAGVISPVLPLVLVFLAAVAWVIFSPLPVVLLFLAAVAWVIFSPLPAVFVAGGGLGDLFCPVSSGSTSVNGSILNSNVSSSSTILRRWELESSNSLLPNALSFCNPFSEMRCSGEIRTSSGEYRVCFEFKTSSILRMYEQSTYSAL